MSLFIRTRSPFWPLLGALSVFAHARDSDGEVRCPTGTSPSHWLESINGQQFPADGCLDEHGRKQDRMVAHYGSGGLVQEGRYLNGLPDGLVTTYYESGKKAVEVQFHLGKQHGTLRAWYENGRMMQEDDWDDGMQHGVTRKWFEDGTMSYEGAWSHGVREGIERIWYPSGQLKQQGSFAHGVPSGRLLLYDVAGKPLAAPQHPASE